MLQRSCGGFGALAFSGLLGMEQSRHHHVPKAKAVIHLYMEGGPSQIDTFDYKPALSRWAGRDLPLLG